MNRIEAAFASAKPGTLMPMISLTERDEVSHVLNRLKFGPTPELRAHVREMGVEAFIEEQLNPESITDYRDVLSMILKQRLNNPLLKEGFPNHNVTDIPLFRE